MTERERKRLARLAELAVMKSDIALANLAKATALRDGLVAKIAELDASSARALRDGQTPETAHLAAKYARAGLSRRRTLLAELARTEATRQHLLRLAQVDEGRRQVLEKLCSQAS